MRPGTLQTHESSHPHGVRRTGGRLDKGGPTGLPLTAIGARQVFRPQHEHLEALLESFLVGHDELLQCK